MKHYRRIGIGACLCALVLCLGATITYKSLHMGETKSCYEKPLVKAPQEENPLEYIGEAFEVLDGFRTHLPLVILSWEEEPPITAKMDIELDRYVTLEGVEPYVSGKLQIIDSTEGTNFISDTPIIESNIMIKRRGNSSMDYQKAQYLIKTMTESGEYRDIDILGMGAEHEWILNGSMADKSMLRNYLGYRLSAEIMPYTPENHYCEVIIKKGDTFTYQGVFLLGESIKQGENRLNISSYQKNNQVHSYLVRRDRFDDGGVNLDTYANIMGISKEYFGLIYPSRRKVTQQAKDYISQDISRIEQILYSQDFKEFSVYENVIDVDSFVNYFLINEFLGSYDSGTYSTYCYKELGGKLTMGPVWDFDGAIDNYSKEPLDVDTLAFQTKHWFRELCKDHTFLNKLEKQYVKLRASTFSDEHMTEVIDEIIDHIGGAQEREWYRWSKIYTGDNRYNLWDYTLEDGTVITRETKEYDHEIYRIKTALRLHGAEIGSKINELHAMAIVTTGALNHPDIWLFIAACIFLIPLYYIARTR